MVDMYYRLVKAGLRPIQKVPDQFRDAVIAGLAVTVLGENKNLIPPQIIPNVLV